MTEEEKTATLPSDVTGFLGMGERKTSGGTSIRPPSFAVGTDDFDDPTKKERRARFKASADMLFSTDVSKLDDAGASALYQSVTEGLFGLPDEDGTVAFGKRASKDPRTNIDMLRKFVKGDYTLIEDPEYTKWRQMDEDAKFQYAREQETTGNKIKSNLKGERGFGISELAGAGMPGAQFGNVFQNMEAPNKSDVIRRTQYETLTDEEKAAYRADVIGDYEEKLSRRQTLATFLQFAHGLSDRAGYLLAKSFSDGTPDAANIEGLPEDERDRVYAAFSLMRGDQKKGRILGIQTDFTDDTVANRLQLGLYGFQQSVVGLVTDTGEMARDAALWTYAKTAMDEAERKEFFKGWDANVRAEQAMKQSLPEASGILGEAFQGLAENLHWFIPYSMIGKGGKLAKGAQATIARAGLQKEVAEGGLTLAKAAVEASRARWLADVEGAVKAGKGAKKISEFSSAIAMRRQLAAVEQYTAALREIPNVVKAAKWKDAAGAGMWAAGEASAFSAFASEYVANADAAGISREESVLTAAAIGLINAKIEQLYVPGLESSLSPTQIKSLTFAAMAQAIKTDGAAGFRKWLANRVSKGVTEGVKVTLSEGAVEEPLQQMAVEHGKAFDKLCGELRANGQATLANEAKALWDSFARTLPNDYATFIDTAADMVPSSLGFGVTTIGNMTRRQHIHNAMTRHANRRAGSTSTMGTAQTMEELLGATDYDAGVVDVIQRDVDARTAVEKHWRGEGGEAQKNPHRFEEAITAARRAWRDPQTGDAVQEIANAAGVDVKTAEVLAQYLQTEAEAAAFSPQARAWSSLNMSLADIDEATIKTVLPGYVEGSFASDPENGIYSGRVRMDDGTEKTIAYRVGDWSEIAREYVEEQIKDGSNLGKSFDARQAEAGNGTRWAYLTPETRRAVAITAANGLSTGKSGIFELTDSKGEKVRVNADDIILLASGRLADIGYGAAATQGTVRHETFHSLWRFVRGTLADADVQQLAKSLGVDVTANGWENELDEIMGTQMERYASGHYVSHAVSSRFDKMLDSWAGKIIDFFGKFGPSDEVTDPKTGKPYQLKGLYDAILRGELGSGVLGVELRKVPAQPATTASTASTSTMPVEVTDADRAEAEAEAQSEADEYARAEEKLVQPQTPKTQGGNATVDESGAAAPKVVHTAENPADAATPNQRYYKVGLPNSPVKLVGRLEVRDVETGIITSTDADYHDRGNQNRDDKSEESRALVEKIGANPDPLQIGTVQPIANNGIVWMLPNGDVIIGNHRVNGVRLGYAKGTTAELEKFVREDAAKRGIEIGADVKKPLMVFVLERIESPDDKADVHEVVRLANESQNRGFNIREQAGNDAKILIDNNLLPRMAFRADGRIDETKSGDAIGKFRQETGAQGMVAEDGSLTEEGQTRIQNAALAALLGGEGNNALLQKIMSNAGRLDMQNEVRALMKMTPELMALAEAKPAYDLRAPLAEALRLFTEWRDKDETARVEKGKTRHDWREMKDGRRVRGLSWEAFMSQGDMFRAPSDEAKILGDLFARAEQLRSFDREDVESAAGKKRVIDLISGYLTDYIANARAVNTETDDMFGGTPASRADVLAAQRRAGGEGGGPRFSVEQTETPRFKAWFGDWENDPANASKVVDRAGRPRVVYHGTPNGKFWTFDKNRIGETWNADETGFFFTSDRHIAEDYTKPYFRENSADPNLFAVYLSIKNPLVIDRNWWQRNYGRSDIYNHDAIEIWDNEQGTILDEMRNGGHDGVIIDPNPMGGAAKMYMVPEPTQIKSATDSTGAFDPRNPDIRYSLAPNPNLREDIAAALRKNSGGDDTTVQMKRHDEIVFSDNLPFFEFLGLPNVKVVTDVVKIRKFNIKHHLSEDQIAELPYRYNAPVAVMRDGTDGYVLLTELMAKDDHDNDKPVMVYLRRKERPSGEVIFIATAFAKNAEDEAEYYGPLMKSGLLFADENKIAGLALGEETESILRTQASGDHVLTSSDYSWWSTQISIAQSSADRNGLSTPAQLLAAVAQGATKHKKELQESPDDGLYSIEAPRSALLYPQLHGMSDDDLIAAAIATRIALGKSDKVSDRSVKINTVQNYMRRLHPDWNTTKIGVESLRIISDAQKFAKRIREDLDRGVSESLILEHLPDTMQEQFGREMRQEAREGARLGAYGARANAAIKERQAQIVEDAVRVQTGLDSVAIENAYGINLSETIMHIAENRLTEKDATPGATGEGEGSADEEGSASAEGSEEAAVEIDAKVKAVVDDIVAASGRQAGSDEQNRQNRKAAAGRDAENEAAMGEGEEGSEGEGDSAGEGFEGDALAEAVKKSALDLENPRHLARFVAELARRQWVKEHHLAQDADVWRDLVAVQFLRKTAQSVYAKLCRDLVYSRSRETAMQRIARLDAVPTVAGLLSEMEFVGALINAQRIRDTQKQLCEKLDLFLRQNFGAQGRFKPDKEEGKRKVSAEAELRARYMRDAMWLTPDAAAEEARRLQETLDALAVDFKDAGRDRDQSREFVETIRKLNVLREFGALRYKPVGEIEAAVQWWQDFARGESDDIVREMSDRDIRTKKAAHLLAVAFADPKRTTIREGGKADALNRFITGHMGFISLLQDCMRHASDADAAAVKDVVDYIAREVQKAGDRSEAEKRRHNDAFHSAVEGIYGKSFNAVMKDMMAPDERFTKYMGVIGGKRVTPTKGRALQLLVSLLQEGRKIEVEDEENPGQTKTVWEGGYHDNIVKHHREGQAAEIMRLLDPADMNMLKWLGQWYENNRADLSQVCHSLFGIGVYAELPNYFPVKMQLETQGLEKGNGVGWTIFPKALTPRVRNERDFDTSADVFSMWASRMEEAAQWKHHAQLGLEMRGIFGRAELREAVRANHGASVDDLMQGFITDILAGHGAYDRSTAGVQYFSDQIRGWTALCALGGNIGVMLKQITSIPAFGFEIGLVNTTKYMVNAFTPEGMAAMRSIWDSEQRRTRWQVGSSEAVRNALSQQNAGALKRMFQASMITNKLGDVVPALVVGQGIYRDCLARGMSEEDAMAETWSIVERTQQSGRMENQIQVQRRNKLGRIMFQFLSTQQQYLQYEVRAIREVIARPDSVKRWGNLGRAILLNHFILTSAYFWMGELYKACLGQEPPEDELKDWLITCLLGPYGSLMVAGFMCKATLERAIKGYTWRSPSMLPMESWLKNQVNDGAKLLEAIFDSDGDTWDNMLEAAGRWMSDSNSTVRDLRKIYRYRVKGEQQKK